MLPAALPLMPSPRKASRETCPIERTHGCSPPAPPPGSAARASLAAQKQDKYLDFHTKLMGFKGPLTDEVVYTVAGQVGLDLDKLKQDMNDPSVVAELRDNMDLAQKLGVQGTPAFVINDQ